ncbi:ChaN family lipoprotein [Amaricoccus sp.]|uniref:ChaN family lipoprotein n=1 Tax=Amaricoccus sp. TaxID=1872485 RepID=UPI001B4A6312|nr:ChaN family lipoprotein [Amaricoccus sp.]MBP7240552.1 ChaN family lipoprotein [Amaricoccus sp.]
MAFSALQIAFALLAASWGAAAAGADDAALADFVERARGADIVFLGERYDNPEHHRRQAEIVRALAPAAIVFAMIPQDREAELNAVREAGGDHAALRVAAGWPASGGPESEAWASIVDAAPHARIFGAAPSREALREAAEQGAAEAFGPDAAIYGLDVPLDPVEQAAREATMRAARCEAVAEDALPGMVEAQRFRDAVIADATLWARIITGDARVVVIAGTAHADRLRGAPAMIALAEPGASVVTLGQFDDDAPAPGEGAFDAVFLTPAPAGRIDPCAGLLAPDDRSGD